MYSIFAVDSLLPKEKSIEKVDTNLLFTQHKAQFIQIITGHSYQPDFKLIFPFKNENTFFVQIMILSMVQLAESPLLSVKSLGTLVP